MSRTAELGRQVIIRNVADRMAERSMSASELARVAGVPRTTLRGWLDGGNFPIVGLSRIARALTVDIGALVEGV